MKPTIIAETKDERGNVTRRLTTKGQRFRNYCRDCGKPTTTNPALGYKMTPLNRVEVTYDRQSQ